MVTLTTTMTTAKTTTTTTCLLIITAIFLAALPRIEAQPLSPAPEPLAAPSPGPDCLTSLGTMADCLTFVDYGSNLTKPDPACCPEVAELVNNQPICLCKMLANSTQFGISIDRNRALKLPSVCSFTTPPVSLCAAIGVPVADSAPSPSAGGSQSPGSPSYFLIGFALVLFTSFF
ncbi:xylogen-like protein 11 [Sesamum indicum]|uniref:Xylogen-like protein 11 n=1 Tax=Sesamum indicum TaxID=4182 RepID=A0A6I9TWG4_SESIN|nr:xylogen-like protein 11 [Sesamum indicum]